MRAQPADLSSWTGGRESNQAVARGIIIRKMLIACFGTFRALWSALLLLREAFRGKKLYFP